LAASAYPFAALAVVGLVELVLFVGYHQERWRKALLPRGQACLRAGEGLVIRCDGHGYYAWLRSLLFDGDWSFDNEFDDHNPLGDWVPPASPPTAARLRPNPWPVGPACTWAVAVIPTHLCLAILQQCGACPAMEGYELPYQLAVGGTTVLASLLGLGFLYGICRWYARPARAALAAAFLTLGTTIIYYAAIEVSMAHGLATVAVAGLIWYWLITYGSDRAGRWLAVGCLVGVAALMRWQLITFALLPAGECLWTCRRRWSARLSMAGPMARLALAGLGAAVSFMPQAAAWRVVYGNWLVMPMATSQNWFCPAWGPVLTSLDRGLFYWTPLPLLALAGFCCRPGQRPVVGKAAGGGPDRDEPLRLLLAAFILQVYVIASLWGEGVYLGASFGFRHVTEALTALAPGLAILLERARRRWFCVLGGLLCLLVFWNLLLIAQYRYGLLPAAGGAGPRTLLANAGQLIVRKKLLLVGQVFAGPLLLWLLVRRGAGRNLPESPVPAL
jgi:hypothetical protein